MSDKNGLKALMNPIYKYGVIVAVLCEIVSLPFLGWNPQFAYGLTLGTSIAIVNYYLLAFAAGRIGSRGRGASLAILGYMARLGIYGAAFYMSYRIGTASGLATLLGYMTLKISTYYVYGFKPGFKKGPPTGKKYNDLDQDGWPEPKPNWITKILKRR
jgi:hypothetical protein